MDKETEEKKHFVLIHGFCHGAWCWYKLVILLKKNGHKVTALDLGGSGIHPKQLQQISSMSDYVHPIMDFMSQLPNDEKVILVGHSYGGIPLSIAMENFPEKISLAVFITACMPKCNDPPAAIIQQEFGRIFHGLQVYFRSRCGKPAANFSYFWSRLHGSQTLSALHIRGHGVGQDVGETKQVFLEGNGR